MIRHRWNWMVLSGALLVFALATPALAGDFSLEGQFGYYDPDSVNQDGQVYGLAVGYDVSPHFGMLLSGGVIDLEDDYLDINSADLQFGLGLLDLSFVWYPTGKSFYVFGGPGYATVDLEIDIPGNNNDIKESDTTFTVNGGLGFRWLVSDHFFVRPELKARWFDGQDFKATQASSYEGLDVQYTLGLGWRF